MKTLLHWILVAGVFSLGGAVLAWQLKPSPPPPLPTTVHDTVRVAAEALRQAAPKPRITGASRITRHAVAPELVIIGEKSDTVPADSHIVLRPADSLGLRRAEPRYQKPGQNVGPPTLPYLAGRYGSGRLELWVGRSDSSVLYQRHRVHAPFDFVTDSAGVHVHEQRAWLRVVKGAAKCGGAAAIGAGAGALLVGKDRLGGAIVGAAAGCAGTIVF